MADSASSPENQGRPPWEQWNRKRALRTTVSLAAAAVTAAFLAVGGSFLFKPVFRSSPSSVERVVGALMVLASMVLLITAPLMVAILRRSVAWKLATGIGISLAAWLAMAVFS